MYQYKIDERRLAIHCISLISGGFQKVVKVKRDLPKDVIQVITVCALIGDFALDPKTNKLMDSSDFTDVILKLGDKQLGVALAKFSEQLQDCHVTTQMLFAKALEVVLE
jgi:hypothetical protein